MPLHNYAQSLLERDAGYTSSKKGHIDSKESKSKGEVKKNSKQQKVALKKTKNLDSYKTNLRSAEVYQYHIVRNRPIPKKIKH